MEIPADAIIIDKGKEEELSISKQSSQDFFQLEPGSVLLDQSEVTGYKALVLNGIQEKKTTEHEVKSGYYMSNILFRNSYIIKGNCRAVVCAVGQNTQYGMTQDIYSDGTAF